jgi:hypothetical protein
LEARNIEMVKLVASYFSTLATTIGSFIILANMLAIVSSKSIVTIQGNKVNVTPTLLIFGILVSLGLLLVSCLILLMLGENEENVANEHN